MHTKQELDMDWIHPCIGLHWVG